MAVKKKRSATKKRRTAKKRAPARKVAKRKTAKRKPARRRIVKKKATRKTRKRNPISRQGKVLRAMKLFQRFRGDDPRYIDEVEIKVPDVCMLIGKCDGILYSTTRDGQREEYIHKFTGKSRPLLVSLWDGSQVFLIGGQYSFTEEGIKDH